MADTPVVKATVGRIVHYVAPVAPVLHRAAMVTEVVLEVGVSLSVFEPDGRIEAVHGVLHSETFDRGTWHWPERD